MARELVVAAEQKSGRLAASRSISAFAFLMVIPSFVLRVFRLLRYAICMSKSSVFAFPLRKINGRDGEILPKGRLRQNWAKLDCRNGGGCNILMCLINGRKDFG